MKTARFVFPLFVSVFVAVGNANAGILTFTGSDSRAPVNGRFTNSNATEASSLSAESGFGNATTETFDTIPVGTVANDGLISIPGASATPVTPFGSPLGGVQSQVLRDLHGLPNSGGNFLAFGNGLVTFNFPTAAYSFGFYTTGVPTVFTTTYAATFDDEAIESLNNPINVNGGASYFGLTDTSSFKSVTITNISNGALAVDDVSFNATRPELSIWTMILLGLGGLGFAVYNRKRKVNSAAFAG